MNDMADALRKAGYKSSFERLVNLAWDAWAESPGKEGALARHRYIRDRLCNELTFQMMQKWHPEELRKSINYLLASTERKENSSVVGFLSTGGGYSNTDNQSSRAPAISSPDPAQAGGGGQTTRDIHSADAPAKNDAPPSAERRDETARLDVTPIAGLPSRPSLSDLAAKQRAATIGRGKMMNELSKLNDVIVELPGGFRSKIGDCTVKQVREWIAIRSADARSAQRDVRFASVLIANLESNVVLKDYWRNPNEVNKIYASAEAEYAA